MFPSKANVAIKIQSLVTDKKMTRKAAVNQVNS